MAKSDQKNITPAPSKSWAAQVEAAKELTEIPPKLNLGGKSESVRHVVEFVEAEPRFLTFRDRFAPRAEWEDERTPPKTDGFAINVRVIESESETVGAVRSIVFRDTSGGMGVKIAGLAKKYGSLEGVRCEIETRFYTHPTYGPNTKGFNVSDMGKHKSDEPL